MKHYQDTITGQIYAFYKYDNVVELMQTNRNIPKNLDRSRKKKKNLVINIFGIMGLDT